MACVAFKPRLIVAIFVAIFAVAASVPAHARTNSSAAMPPVRSKPVPLSTSSKDTSVEAPPTMVVADFNGDGIADMAKVTFPDGNHSGTSALTVMLGQANGTFKPTNAKLTLGRNPQSIVTGDFNHDGFPDVIVGDDDGSLLLFLGNGHGGLVPSGTIAHLDSVVSISVADFNHDGILDLAVSDWRASTVTIFLGTGDGSFRRDQSFPLRMPGTVPQIVAADFNGDGIPDLAVVYGDDDGYTFDVMLGDGKGDFTKSPKLSRGPNPGCPT